MAVDSVVEQLKKMSRPVTTPEEICQVGYMQVLHNISFDAKLFQYWNT